MGDDPERGASPIIRVRGLRYRYEGASSDALSDIDLSVVEGSCFGLLGPNGAGKTTLISLLTGLLRSHAGEIDIGGYSLPREAGAIKRISALVPQEYAFYPSLSGRENFDFFAGLYRVPASERQQRMARCIEICGLDAVLDRPAADYSGGVKRRLNLALGLLCKPRILYLDEPTVGIDAQSRHFILEAIEGLKASGMTIIYTSHYMEEVEQICDEVAIVDQGRVLLQETTASLLQGGGQLYVTLAAVPDADTIRALQAEFELQREGSRLVVQRAGGGGHSALLAALEDAGLTVERLSLGAHRLEEIYLGITRPELRG